MGILCGFAFGFINLNNFSLKFDLIYTGIKGLLLTIMGQTFKGTTSPNRALERSNVPSAVELPLLPPFQSLNGKCL